MGKKSGGSAPSPDPQIGRAALMQARLGQQGFNFYKQEYLNNKPAVQRQTALAEKIQQQMVESGEFNNKVSKEYYDYMQSTFRPLEKDIVDNANKYDTAGRRETEANKGLADVRQSFDSQREITQRNNERMGINPNSGNAQALDHQMDIAEAMAGARAKNQGRKQAEMTGHAMKMDAASLGRNLPSNQATSQQVANSTNAGALNVGLANMQNVRAGANQMGRGFGMAMQGYNNQANILNSQYRNQLAGWQAEQQRKASSFAGLGTLAGVLVGSGKLF